MTVRKFAAIDGEVVKANGTQMLKKPNPVYLWRQSEPFTVDTNEGTLSGKAGDYVAHDPMSGHVWPVAADYVQMHYEPIKG